MKKGIDVSAHQGVIDWNAVKSSGIDFAILRCGYGNDDPDQDDAYFLKNVKACEKVGMPYGVYLYSYATSIEDAKSEAAHVMRLIKGLKPEYPIYYDLEDPVTGNCSNEKILQIAKTFVTTLEKAGYQANVIEGIKLADAANTLTLNNKIATLPAAEVSQYGLVKLSSEIGVNTAGNLEIKNLNLSKITQDEEDWLILDGGTSTT